MNKVKKERSCRICGCTWNNACPGGCYWVEYDLCSQCDFNWSNFDYPTLKEHVSKISVVDGLEYHEIQEFIQILQIIINDHKHLKVTNVSPKKGEDDK